MIHKICALYTHIFDEVSITFNLNNLPESIPAETGKEPSEKPKSGRSRLQLGAA
jgi:hypothetical protein